VVVYKQETLLLLRNLGMIYVERTREGGRQNRYKIEKRLKGNLKGEVAPVLN
jgi:hypothetical protein